MAAYTGYRHVLPQQNSANWTHQVTGEEGVYSNYSLMSDTQLLEDAPLRNRLTDPSEYNDFNVVMQEYLGLFEYNPMELQKYSHGGQSVPYMRHAPYEYHGLEGAHPFPEGYGEEVDPADWPLYYKERGVPSQLKLDGGHPQRLYGEGAANFGPFKPYEYRGAGDDVTEDPGTSLSTKQGDEATYGFDRVREWNGVESAQVL